MTYIAMTVSHETAIAAIVSMTFVLHCRLRRRLWPFPTKGLGRFNQLQEGHPIPAISRQNARFRPFGKYHDE
jgi:hypothetical protein